MPERTLFLAFSNPVEGREVEFDAWYGEVHIPDLLNLPGVINAQRYVLADAASNESASHRRMVVYEIEGDPDDLMKALATGVGDGSIVISDALDMSDARLTFWRPVGEQLSK